VAYTQKENAIRWRLLLGTVRRFVWCVFRPGYVKKQLASRKGECKRCGACCYLAWKCPYFTVKDGLPSCAVYNKFRFPNCTKFPIDHYDIADRNAVSPNTQCGYYWNETAESQPV
jgi:hypothetical protein